MKINDVRPLRCSDYLKQGECTSDQDYTKTVPQQRMMFVSTLQILSTGLFIPLPILSFIISRHFIPVGLSNCRLDLVSPC